MRHKLRTTKPRCDPRTHPRKPRFRTNFPNFAYFRLQKSTTFSRGTRPKKWIWYRNKIIEKIQGATYPRKPHFRTSRNRLCGGGGTLIQNLFIGASELHRETGSNAPNSPESRGLSDATFFYHFLEHEYANCVDIGWLYIVRLSDSYNFINDCDILVTYSFSFSAIIKIFDRCAARYFFYDTCVVWLRLDCQSNARRLSQIKADNLANNNYFYLYAFHIVHNFHCKTIILCAVHSFRCNVWWWCFPHVNFCLFVKRVSMSKSVVQIAYGIPKLSECDGKSA